MSRRVGRPADVDAAVHASRVERGIRLIRAALADRDAVAFVHAADDADAAYLGTDAVVVTADRVVRLGEPSVGERPPRHDPDGVTDRVVDDPAAAVTRVAREATTDAGTVLTPRSIRHDVALFLERAGFDVVSTAAVTEARAVKTPAEHTALRSLGTAVTTAIDAVVERLSTATVDDGRLRFDTGDAGRGASAELTAQRVAREVAVELAHAGVDAADSRVWSVDGPRLAAGRPIVIVCRPVGPGGTRLHAARTLVVDGDGGWERRAALALDHAHRAGRGRLAAALDGESVTAGEVASEVRAELAAYGFETPDVAVHGVGCASRERPRDGDEVEAGQALVAAASLTRADDETASERRRTDVVTHTETLLLDEDVERLVPLPASLSTSRT